MQSASYTSKSSSRETKVNDQNKAGVETEIVHTNTAKTKSEMVSHIATTKRYCKDSLQEKVEKLLKHNRKLNFPKTNLTYDSKLVLKLSAMQGKTVSFQNNFKGMLCWYYQDRQYPGLNRLQETLTKRCTG